MVGGRSRGKNRERGKGRGGRGELKVECVRESAESKVLGCTVVFVVYVRAYVRACVLV